MLAEVGRDGAIGANQSNPHPHFVCVQVWPVWESTENGMWE